MKSDKINEIIDKITKRLSARTEIISIYLLGSAATGKMRPDSDIDIALLLKPGYKMSSIDLFNLTGELTEIAGVQVDLGVISTLNLIYAKEAFFNGKEVFCRDRAAADLQRATLLGLYGQLQFQRKEIVNAYTT